MAKPRLNKCRIRVVKSTDMVRWRAARLCSSRKFSRIGRPIQGGVISRTTRVVVYQRSNGTAGEPWARAVRKVPKSNGGPEVPGLLGRNCDSQAVGRFAQRMASLWTSGGPHLYRSDAESAQIATMAISSWTGSSRGDARAVKFCWRPLASDVGDQ